MAKITARNSREVCRWRTTSRTADAEYLFVLRSDGALLWRLSRINGSTYSGSYKIRGKLPATVTPSERVAWVTRYLAKRYDDVKVGA